MQTIIEAFNNNSNVDLNVSADTISDVDVTDLAYLSPNAVHHKTPNIESQHENLSQNSVRMKC